MSDKASTPNPNSRSRTHIRSVRERIDRPIALVGLMGSGKSMLGRKLAQKLDIPFADSDVLVEEKAGISITDIFDIGGEEKFRDIERRAIAELAGGGQMVIATGGGAPCHESSAEILQEQTIMVWLQASAKTLLARIGSTNGRPLLATGDPLATLERLIDERKSYYGRAHIHLNTNGLSGAKALDALIASLDDHLPLT